MKFKPNWNTVSLSILLLLIGSIIALALAGYSKPLEWHNALFNEGKDTNLGGYVKLIGATIGGLIVFWGLLINNERVRQQTEQNKISERGQIGTRFKDAAQLLTQDSTSANLAGVYALHQIAIEVHKSQDQLEYIKTIHDLLCAYVRENCPVKREKGIIVETKRKKEDIVIQTIIDKLARDKNSELIYKDLRIDFSYSNLKELSLGQGYFKEAFLIGADIRGVLFGLSNLENAFLSKADLYGSNFVGSNLTDATLDDALLQRNYFQNAKLSYLYIHNSEIANILEDSSGEKYIKYFRLITAFPKSKIFTEEELEYHFEFTQENLSNKFLVYDSLREAILIMDKKEYKLIPSTKQS